MMQVDRKVLGLAAGALVAALTAWSASAETPPAAPGQTPSKPQAASHPKPDPGQVVICRDEQVTGSIISRKRTCKTRRAWDEQATATEQELEQGRILGKAGSK
jgi:hypothetical protein